MTTTSRMTHIIRVFGTNSDGDVLADVYVDLERIDLLRTQEQIDGFWQGTIFRFRWFDDPNGDDGDQGNPNRLWGVRNVCSPEQPDPTMPDEWVPIKVPIQLMLRTSHENNGQIQLHGFQEGPLNISRQVTARRFYHYDTNIDDDAGAAADNGATVYVVSGDQYTQDISTQDTDTYVEAEISAGTYHRLNIDTRTGQGSDQGALQGYKAGYLLDISDPAQLTDPSGPDGFNPPWGLGPLQNIVNVNWGDLAVEFFDKAT